MASTGPRLGHAVDRLERSFAAQAAACERMELHVEGGGGEDEVAQALSEYVWHSKRIESASRALHREDQHWCLQPLYPRRWYDTLLPVNLPWDGRQTLAEQLDVSRARGQRLLATVALQERASGSQRRGLGVLLVLVLAPLLPSALLWAHGVELGECSPDAPKGAKCLHRPEWMLGLACGVGAFCLVKFTTLDFTRHYTQCVPDQLRGAIPATHRGGFVGHAERIGALWNFVNTLVALLLSSCQYAAKFSSGELMLYEPVDGRVAAIAPSQVAGGDGQGLQGCIISENEEEALQRAQRCFGVLSMSVFMAGFVVLVVGELFKVRPRQQCVLSQTMNMQMLFNRVTPLRMCSFFRTLRPELYRVVNVVSSQLGPEETIEDRVRKVDGMLHKLVDNAGCRLWKVFDEEMVVLILSSDLCRLCWTMACQGFGFVLWLPITFVYTSPCFGVDVASLSGQWFSDFHEQKDIGLQCWVGVGACLAILLAALAVRPCRRMSLSVGDALTKVILFIMVGYCMLMFDWDIRLDLAASWRGESTAAGGRAALAAQQLLIFGYLLEAVLRIAFSLCCCTAVSRIEVRDFVHQVRERTAREFDLVLQHAQHEEVQLVVAHHLRQLEERIDTEATSHIERSAADSDSEGQDVDGADGGDRLRGGRAEFYRG